jgi:hypothetical protein
LLCSQHGWFHRSSQLGIQNLDWQFEGEDITAVCRTAWDGANYHDSNYIIFHRLVGFQTLPQAAQK